MTTITGIDDSTPEGKLLLMAIGLIGTLEPYTNKTPDEILDQLEDTAAAVYGDRRTGGM